jgi:Flp pilus assembly protein TadG
VPHRVVRRGLLRGERGAATTEAVLVTPVLLVLIMLVVQFGLWYHGSHVAVAAAQEGARAARLEGGSTEAGTARARSFLDSLGREVVGRPQVNAERNPSRARVEVRGTAVAVVPGLHLPIRAVSEGPVERFRPDTEELGISEASTPSEPTAPESTAPGP